MCATDDSFVSVQNEPIQIFCNRVLWGGYVQTLDTICVIEIRDHFFFLATCATSFRIMTPYFTEWINILPRTPSIWFLVDCNARSALFITPDRICCKGNPENQAQFDRSFLYLLLVTSLRFNLVYLCYQFVFSAAALHFLVRWISRLIALWSKGVYIPSLHFLWPWTLTSFFFVIGKWRPLFL